MARRISAVLVSALALAFRSAAAQTGETRPALLQLEVGDSIGLPLPDAKVEVYTLMDQGIFREWVWVDPSSLPEGIHLLRFSYPGYRASVFSVPLRKGTVVSLRVRLGSEPDTTNRKTFTEASQVRSIGILMEGRSKRDIIKTRRVLARDEFARRQPVSIVELMREAKGMHVIVSPGGPGNAMIGDAGDGGLYGCPLPVMINGDLRFLSTFAEATARYAIEDLEAVELIPRTAVIPYVRRTEDGGCGLLVLWVRQR